jgi:hypothetical protein
MFRLPLWRIGVLCLSASSIALLTTPASAVTAPPPTELAIGDDPVARLESLLQRLRDRRVGLQKETILQAKSYIADTRLLWSVDPTRAQDAALAMLDVMGTFLDALHDDRSASPEAELKDAAVETLQAHMDTDFMRWLASDVLSVPRIHPVERRLAVLRLFETKTVPSAKVAILACTMDHDPRIKMAALRALVGWDDDVIHSLFLPEIEKPARAVDPAVLALAERHFGEVHFAKGSRVADHYAATVRVWLLSKDWREAVRGAELQRPVDSEVMVPVLIESLSLWKSRGDAGEQSLRVRWEIQRALQERSGRSFGVDPEVWRGWWAGLHAPGGKVGSGVVTGGGAKELTEGTFFGIRPRSDRIVFVIDRSGSMSTPFGAPSGERGFEGHTRWDEAVGQLTKFVEGMGAKGKFNVVVFHDLAESWKTGLVAASAENVKAVTEWLRMQKPNGGTQFKEGVDAALSVGTAGNVDVGKLEADTVIVLCDGQTAEGPGWVDGFLDRVEPVTRVVFHCVQIGNEGDETLGKLAKGTHGDSVKIDG